MPRSGSARIRPNCSAAGQWRRNWSAGSWPATEPVKVAAAEPAVGLVAAELRLLLRPLQLAVEPAAVGPAAAAVAAVRYGSWCGWCAAGTVDSGCQHLSGQRRKGPRTWQHRLRALNGSVAPTRPRQQRATLP